MRVVSASKTFSVDPVPASVVAFASASEPLVASSFVPFARASAVVAVAVEVAVDSSGILSAGPVQP